MEFECNPTILIVDDTPTNVRMLADALGDYYRIRFATSGQSALNIASGREKPDLILLDIVMPLMDGYEVCRRLKENAATREIPVIFVTARSDVHDEQRGFEIGAVDYITKPFELAIVKARVHTHVTLRRQALLLETLAAVDGLTGIANRRRFDEELTKEWRRALREVSPLSVLMLDVDHFKAYNDHYGHGAGDECLRRVAHVLKNSVKRAPDLVARYGGEEFAVILPEVTREALEHVGERMRSAVESMHIRHCLSTVSPYVTVSVGCATRIPHDQSDPNALVDAADKALYQAKAEGRNLVRSRAYKKP